MTIRRTVYSTIAVILAPLALGTVSSTAMADAAARAHAVLPGSGGIRDWRADGNEALFIQGPTGKWYHAELLSPCLDLPFVDDIGFITRPAGTFDKFSAILVKNQKCQLKSLEPSDGPPPKKRPNS